MTVLCSCHKEELPIGDNSNKNNGITIHLSIPQETVVQTRGASLEKSINDLWLLVFDGNDDDAVLTDVVGAIESDRSTIEQREFFGKLNAPSSDARYGYIVANVPTVMGTILENNIWVMGETTLANVKLSLIKTPLVTVNGTTGAMPKLSPFISGVISFPDGIRLDAQIGSSTVPVELTRVTAKVTIANNTGDANFSIIGANLINVPTRAYLFPDLVGTTGYNIPLCNYGEANGTGNPSIEFPLVAANTSFPLYLYESAESNKTGLIVKAAYKGVDGFYKIDLADENGFLNLLRNHHYIVNINKAGHSGYRTAQEALNNTALNKEIEVEIVVIDGSSHDIVSNGSEYMGVSNSETIIYQTGILSGIEISELNYTVRTGWSAGQITVSGNGLTLVGSNVLTATNTTGRKINANLTAAFTTGTLTVRIGDLSRVITIRRNPTYTKQGGMITVFSPTEYVQVNITDTHDQQQWVSLLPTATSTDTNAETLTNPSGGIFLKVRDNVGFGLVQAHRQAELYIARANDKGRVKVIIMQDGSQPNFIPAASRPWLGAFWRNDQTGERIIGMTKINNANITGNWSAEVIEGADFIRLTTTHDDLPLANGSYADPNAENYQITGGVDKVIGTGAIYFRIGLTGENPNPETPRYGCVLLSVNGYKHPIFIRQGEEADYIMRTSDPVYSEGVYSTSRPLARKFSPFNLSDPAKGLGGGLLENHNIVPVKGGVFTNYPSQAGYLFNFSSGRAFSPSTPNQPDYIALPSTGITTWVLANPISAFNASTDETCPQGYRRPTDDASVNNSEMRQSLFLEPTAGSQDLGVTGVLTSSMWGYYADGYFDRCKIEDYTDYKMNAFAPTTNAEAMVSPGTPDVAYYGRLVYNPKTYAHIFIPAAGTRLCSGVNNDAIVNNKGRLMAVGQYGYIMTKSVSGGAFWYFSIGEGRSTMGLGGTSGSPTYNGYIFSIRCVKDE